MFTVIVSGVGNRVKWTQVKTKSPVEKVTQHLISCRKTGPFPIMTCPGTARQLLPSDVVLLEHTIWGQQSDTRF